MADQKAKIYLSGWSLVTHSDVSSLLGKTLSTAEQTLITSLIKQVELYICRQCNRQFKLSQTYYETVDAGKSRYDVCNIPILAVTKITVDGNTKYEASGEDNSLTLNQDFFVYDDYVEFATLVSSSVDNRNAMVLYYTIDEFWGEEVKLAITRFVSDLFVNREYATNRVQSIGISGGLNLTFDTKSVPAALQEIIDAFRLQNV